MTIYRFYRTIRTIVLLAFVPVVGLFACISLTISEILRELDFQRHYGKDWKSHYEEMFGSLSQAHVKIGIGIVGIIGIISATVWLIKALGKRPGHKRRRHPGATHAERLARFKRNAVVGIYFGLPGIVLSVLLAVFRMGIFKDHANEIVLAIFVFLGSYGTVVTGCYWWLRAKAWNEAVISIAFLPLIIFFIPYVRLLVLVFPHVMAAAMIMMTLILVTIVAVLPDKSKSTNSRRPMDSDRH